MKYAVLYLAAIFTCNPCAYADTVHRWVDERGVVNYGDTPPRDVRATAVPTRDPLKTAGPSGAANPSVAPAGQGPAQPDRALVRDEVEQALQRQNAAQAAETRKQEEAAWLTAKRRCEEQRRVDCDENPFAETHADGPPVLVRRRSVWVNPHPPLHPPGYLPPRHPHSNAPSAPREKPALMRRLD
jgi:hypothetical protein